MPPLRAGFVQPTLWQDWDIVLEYGKRGDGRKIEHRRYETELDAQNGLAKLLSRHSGKPAQAT